MENGRYNSTNFNGGSRWKVCSQPYPRQKAHGIYWPGTVGGVAGLECWGKKNLYRESKPDTLVVLFVAGLEFIHSLVFSLEGRAWPEPEPSHVTDMALANCILGKFFGVVCHCFPPPLAVLTLAARCLRLQRHERS